MGISFVFYPNINGHLIFTLLPDPCLTAAWVAGDLCDAMFTASDFVAKQWFTAADDATVYLGALDWVSELNAVLQCREAS